MSNEVFEMICAMDRRNIELQIGLQCAPVVAGLKTSNLLIVPREDEDLVRAVLRHSGLLNYRLAYDRHRVIFLVFDRDILSAYLAREDVTAFLNRAGYRSDSFGYILRTFQERYAAYIAGAGSFPHEIGVLLGYPLCDVTGFIDNGGAGFLYSGYWKVYANVDETRQLFDEFDAAKDEILISINAGSSIRELIDNYRRPAGTLVG